MRGRRARVVVVAGVLLVSGCGVAPDDPEAGEMTGVVLSGDDTCCWPGGGGVVGDGSYDAVVLLDADDHADLAATGDGFTAPLDDLAEGGDPASGPAWVRLDEGRWRTPYGADEVVVCVGATGRDDDTGEALMVVRGCGLLDRPAPVAVTVTLHLGTTQVEVVE